MIFDAAVLVSHNKIVLDKLEIPKLRYGQVLVKMFYSSICQTQVGEIIGTRGKDLYLPHCLGHEAVGKVIDKDKSVKKVSINDKVCLSWIKGRGIDSGGTQYKNIKGKIINAGPVNTFSEYAVISENRLYKLSNKDDAKSSVLLGCAVPTGFNSIFYSLKNIKNGPICIFGCGGVGLATIIACKIKKLYPIIGIDINPTKFAIAKKFGADKVFQFNKNNFNYQLNKYCKTNFPAMIECTGKIDVLKFCMSKANNFGGKIVVIGNYPIPSNFNLNPWDIISGKTLMGAWNDQDYFDKKFILFKKKLKKNYQSYFFGNSSYSLSQINLAVKDFVKGKVVRPLIKF